MIVYSVDLDGKDSDIDKEFLAAGEAPFSNEIEDREAAFLMIENHLLNELKAVIKKIREVRELKRSNY